MPTLVRHRFPSWFKKTSLEHTFMNQCPTDFTMPDGHEYGVLESRNFKTVSNDLAYRRGVNYIEFQQFSSESWFGTNDARNAKISVFANDAWTRIASGPANHPQGVSDWINISTAEQVWNAYVQGSPPNNMGFIFDDLEAFPFIDIRGARNLYATWKRHMDAKNANCKYFGGWNTHFFNGGDPEKLAEIYTKTQAQLYVKPSDYGFSALWCDPLYSETPTDKRRLIYGFNYACMTPYQTGIFDDLTTRTIQAAEATKKVFPDITPATVHWSLQQVSNTGATYFPAGPRGYYRGNKFRYNPNTDKMEEKGEGIWAKMPDGIPYPPDVSWNLYLWGTLFGITYSWYFGGKDNDKMSRTYHGNDYEPTDFADMARWTWAGVPNHKSILSAGTSVELPEYSLDGGATWKTGKFLTPGIAQRDGLPIIRLKKSASGNEMVILAYHEKALNGTTTQCKVRIGDGQTVDINAKRFTEVYYVTL